MRISSLQGGRPVEGLIMRNPRAGIKASADIALDPVERDSAHERHSAFALTSSGVLISRLNTFIENETYPGDPQTER
jgi:hypothetical protein